MALMTEHPHRVATTTSLRVEAWRDEVVEAHGHDPRSSYVSRFWLPIIGPSSLIAAGFLVESLHHSPDGFDVKVDLLGLALGLPGKGGGHSKIARTLDRLTQFGLARFHPVETPLYRVRLAWPPLTQRQLRRLPDFLAELHAAA